MSVSDVLIKEWKSIIESLEVDGYRRVVDSTDFFLMSTEPRLCYKVNFNFPLQSTEYFNEDVEVYRKWNWELDKIFTDICKERKSDQIYKGSASESINFKNSKVDYFQNQGYRFIIQFYPEGFLPEIREKKLNQILF
jgi:hypothetical protein